jgi:DNA ligase (NAD+)
MPQSASSSKEKLTPLEARLELAKLADEIALHDKKYHQEDNPSVSDADYDKLRAAYRALAATYPNEVPPNDPEKRVGAPASEGFSKINHRVPMLSLGNAFTDDDIHEFMARISRFLQLADHTPIAMMAETKVDGLSASLRYEDGILIQAATRGDGMTGENITANAMTIKNVPKKLTGKPPAIFEVRGEIYMYRDDFMALNAAREKAGEPPFANPRNAAAGSVRQLDATITATRPLRFAAYSFGEVSAPFADQQEGLRKKLQSFGFDLNEPAALCEDSAALLRYYKKIMQDRPSIPYDIDGVVYKVNRFDWQERLGFVSRAPRFAIAHKFPAEQAETRLLNITVQVGRTGVLTPVAELEPINVGGVMVSRATLHNEDELARKDIRIGDLVRIQRAGDVIPQILSVNEAARPKGTLPFVMPTHCPECGSMTVRREGQVARRCTGGLRCPAQVVERLYHFVSRQALNIEGLGPERVKELWQDGLIKTPVDIFRLQQHEARLRTKEGWGEKSVTNLLQNIEARRQIPLDKFIYALGIPQIGEASAKLLARHYQTLDVLITAITGAADKDSPAYTELLAIDQIGAAMADDLIGFFGAADNLHMLQDLVKILMLTAPAHTQSDHPLAGKVIVFTGTLEKMGRSEAKSQAEALGAIVASAVSKKTDYVVAGIDAGSKLKKAEELGVTIIDEQAWLTLASWQRA